MKMQRTSQNGGQADENFKSTSSGPHETSRKLAAFTGILFIGLVLCLLIVFFIFRPFQRYKNGTETRLEFLEEKNQNLTGQVASVLKTLKASPGTSLIKLPEKKVLLDLLYDAHMSAEAETCGGSIKISEEPFLFRYKNPGSNTSDCGRRCIWVMWTTLASTMKVRLFDLSGEVTIYGGFESDKKAVAAFQNWSTDPFKEIVLNSYIAVVVFTPKSPSTSSPTKDVTSIDFRFADHLPPPVIPKVSVTTLIADSPIHTRIEHLGDEYNERRFTFFFPSAGQNVSVKVNTVNTEAYHDSLYVYLYSSSTRQFKVFRQLQGNRNFGDRICIEGDTNQPILLYYYTDSSVKSGGYTATYYNALNIKK